MKLFSLLINLFRSGVCVPQECRSHEHCKDFFQDTGLEGYKCIKQVRAHFDLGGKIFGALFKKRVISLVIG